MRWGTARPTKAMGPAKAVMLPASRLVARMIINLLLPILTPRLLAYCSPSNRVFKFLMQVTANIIPVNQNIDNIDTSSQDRFPRLPKDQKIYCCNCEAGLKYASTLTTAAVRLANINPIIRMAMVSRNFAEASKTASSTSKLPILEAITMLHFDKRI